MSFSSVGVPGRSLVAVVCASGQGRAGCVVTGANRPTAPRLGAGLVGLKASWGGSHVLACPGDSHRAANLTDRNPELKAKSAGAAQDHRKGQAERIELSQCEVPLITQCGRRNVRGARRRDLTVS